MNLKILILPAFSALLLATTGAVADGPALPPPPIKQLPAPVTSIKAPGDLGGKRPEMFNKALARAGLPPLTLPPGPAHIRLTPGAPTAAGGARIVSVGRSTYLGASADAPDGAFIIEPAYTGPPQPLPDLPYLPPIPTGRIELEFATELGKTYMLDCRTARTGNVGPAPGPVHNVWFGRPTTVIQMSTSSDDGHQLYGFRADTIGMANVHITFKQNPAYFFGCDITKTN